MTFNTTATPHKGILHNKETDTKIPYDLQKRYRSGVVLLLYLVKHSCPELSNAVHELFKCTDRAKMVHYKNILRTTKYEIDKKYYCY